MCMYVWIYLLSCSATSEEVGEIPVAFIVKRPGSELSSEDVINYVSGQVIGFQFFIYAARLSIWKILIGSNVNNNF